MSPAPSFHRGQSNVVGVVLISGLLVAGIASTMLWGVPLIQKNRDRATINLAEDSLGNLNKKIVAVARQGGSRTVSFEVSDGFLTVETMEMVANDTGFPGFNLTKTDYIEFQATTQAAYVATEEWVPVNENDVQGTSANNYRGSGFTGRDKEGVILGRAETQADAYRTTFKLEYRLLEDSENRGFKIDLVKNGKLKTSTSGTKEIVVKRGERYSRTLNGDPVNVVEVLIHINE